jgi:hypothetical protein
MSRIAAGGKAGSVPDGRTARRRAEHHEMAGDLPSGLDERRNVRLEGRGRHPGYRRVLLTLLAVLPVLALLNVFGQKPVTSFASSSAATLTVDSPEHLRGGLIYQGRFEIKALRNIAHPTLVLDTGWWEGMSVNSIEPQPSTESTQNGKVTLSFDSLSAGQSLVVWIYYQVNPTNVGHRNQSVVLADGTTPLITIQRKVTVFP